MPVAKLLSMFLTAVLLASRGGKSINLRKFGGM